VNWIGAPLLLHITHIRKSTMDEVTFKFIANYSWRCISRRLFNDSYLRINGPSGNFNLKWL